MAANREGLTDDELLDAERELARMVLADETPDAIRVAILYRVGATWASPRTHTLRLSEIKIT